jgi:DNA-binding transcriptional ArsR family regulator
VNAPFTLRKAPQPAYNAEQNNTDKLLSALESNPGKTCQEYATMLNMNPSSASGALSILHKDKRVRARKPADGDRWLYYPVSYYSAIPDFTDWVQHKPNTNGRNKRRKKHEVSRMVMDHLEKSVRYRNVHQMARALKLRPDSINNVLYPEYVAGKVHRRRDGKQYSYIMAHKVKNKIADKPTKPVMMHDFKKVGVHRVPVDRFGSVDVRIPIMHNGHPTGKGMADYMWTMGRPLSIDQIEQFAKDYVWDNGNGDTIRSFVKYLRSQSRGE